MKHPKGFIEFIILGVIVAIYILLWILDRTVFSNQRHERRSRRDRFGLYTHPEEILASLPGPRALKGEPQAVQ